MSPSPQDVLAPGSLPLCLFTPQIKFLCLQAGGKKGGSRRKRGRTRGRKGRERQRRQGKGEGKASHQPASYREKNSYNTYFLKNVYLKFTKNFFNIITDNPKTNKRLNRFLKL